MRIIPDNQQRYASDPRFNNIDSSGRRFATIGAGPVRNRLVSDINRPLDRTLVSGGQRVTLPDGCNDEDAFIDRLFALDQAYGDNEDYDLFPAISASQRWWIADDGYNSNSYAAGLISATGAKLPGIPVNAPGWFKPVPIIYFLPHR